MTVYVVQGSTEYEGSWLVSIHASPDGAEAVRAAEQAAVDRDIAEINDPAYLIRTGAAPVRQSTFFDVTPMEVQP